jgi:hypothetical protein
MGIGHFDFFLYLLYGTGMETRSPVSPRAGRTYSLYGLLESSDDYYARIRSIADACRLRVGDPGRLLQVIRRVSRRRRYLRACLHRRGNGSLASFLVWALRSELSQYTTSVGSHLASLPVLKRIRGTLSTTEEQYHLSMLEIELVNRLHAEEFRRSGMKLAFLPHCLRDLEADCQSVQRGIDYVCKGCSARCNVNAVSKLLRRHGVRPYIWRTANLRTHFRQLRKEGKSFSVLGIACVPELVRGMRMCAQARVPVVGIPLDANRCARWWGEFYPSTVNMKELSDLLLGPQEGVELKTDVAHPT